VIQVTIQNIHHGQMGAYQPPFFQDYNWLVLVDRSEKLTITGDLLISRSKRSIGYKSNFDLFGSHILCDSYFLFDRFTFIWPVLGVSHLKVQGAG
jgi:hypothetical protein